MAELELNYAAASDKAKIVEDIGTDINNTLNSLVEEMDSNLNNASVWQGQSASKFKSTWNDCAADFSEFVKYVRSVQEKIDLAAGKTSGFDQGAQ